MKKIIFFALFVTIVATSCKNNQSSEDQKEDTQTEKDESEKKITKRNYSINKSNSYTDLFLDSLKMENFIATNKLNDTISRRIRSFYNARNYQYAWFVSDGVTEQGRS